MIKMGNPELTRLWNLNTDNMAACKSHSRYGHKINRIPMRFYKVPFLREYFDNISHEIFKEFVFLKG